MKVILTEKVQALGNIGELVNVKDGFARNFLLPNRFAVVADDRNKQVMEDHKRRLQKKIDAEKKEALDIKKKLDSTVLEYTKRVAANGKLFGTIGAQELSQTLKGMGIVLERRQILVEQPIKSTGDFTVKAKIFSDVEAEFKVKVVIDPIQLEEMKKAQAAAELRAKTKKEAKAQEGAEGEEAEGAEGAETPETDEE